MTPETNSISNNQSFEINLDDQEIPSTNYQIDEAVTDNADTNEIKNTDNKLEKGSCLREVLQILQIWWLCEQLGLCDINFN
jgi:hypothetical protein